MNIDQVWIPTGRVPDDELFDLCDGALIRLAMHALLINDIQLEFASAPRIYVLREIVEISWD